jgi:hypothetical protein
MNYQEVFDYFPSFVTKYTIDGQSYGGQRDPHEDDRIPLLASFASPKGMRVLELGPLEAGHSLLLHNLGAREVISLEGRLVNYLKCCVIKNIFQLSSCQFILDDFRNSDLKAYGAFDLCLCMGVLYHVPNPAQLLHRVAEIAPTVWMWTHYADEEYPEEQVTTIEYLDPSTNTARSYRGKYYHEELENVQAGLQRDSFWLMENDLVQMIKDAGFSRCEVLARSSVYEKAKCATIFASKV